MVEDVSRDNAPERIVCPDMALGVRTLLRPATGVVSRVAAQGRSR